MNIDEYVERAVRLLKNHETNKAVREELRGAIIDRAEYYMSIGYDEETAYSKAVERMGNADIAGEQLGKLHNSNFETVLIILFVIAYLTFAFLQWFGLLAWGPSISFLTLINEAVAVTLSMLSLFFAERLKSQRLLFVSMPVTVIYIIIRCLYKSSGIVTSLYFIMTGNARDYFYIIWRTDDNSTPFSFLSIIAFIMFAVWLAMYAVTYLNIKRFCSCNYTLKNVRLDKLIKCSCIFALLLMISSALLINYSDSNNIEDENYLLGAYIVESDDKVDFHKLKDTSKRFIEINHDFGERYVSYYGAGEIYDEEMQSGTLSFKGLLEYKVYTISCSYYTDKKYVAFVPSFNGYEGVEYEDFDMSDWCEASETDNISGEISSGNIIEYYYDIKILK